MCNEIWVVKTVNHRHRRLHTGRIYLILVIGSSTKYSTVDEALDYYAGQDNWTAAWGGFENLESAKEWGEKYAMYSTLDTYHGKSAYRRTLCKR